MALARAEKTGQRFYSMSGQIRAERNEYYGILERTQKSDLDITRWQSWFLECLLRAIEGARGTLSAVLIRDQTVPARAPEAPRRSAQSAARLTQPVTNGLERSPRLEAPGARPGKRGRV